MPVIQVFTDSRIYWSQEMSSVIPSPVLLHKYLLIFFSGRKGERVNVINSLGSLGKLNSTVSFSFIDQLVGVLTAVL